MFTPSVANGAFINVCGIKRKEMKYQKVSFNDYSAVSKIKGWKLWCVFLDLTFQLQISVEWTGKKTKTGFNKCCVSKSSLYVKSFPTHPHSWILHLPCWILPCPQGVSTHPHSWILHLLCWILLCRNIACPSWYWYAPTQLNPSPSMLNPSSLPGCWYSPTQLNPFPMLNPTLSLMVLVLTHTAESFPFYVESFPTGTHSVSQGVKTQLRTTPVVL